MTSFESFIEKSFGDRQTTIGRDLKLNLKKLVFDGPLGAEDALLVVLASASSVQHKELQSESLQALNELSVSAEIIQEAKESAGIMAMVNTYYRFRHMMETKSPETVEAYYKSAGLRMTALAKPVMGKLRFELLAFAISVLNGCETCITSHEQVLRDGGMPPEKIHDAAKLASVIKACQHFEL